MIKLRLKELREEKGLSQEKLAKEMGVKAQTISHYELGLREPNFDIIEKLCKYFEVSAGYLRNGRLDSTHFKLSKEAKGCI